MVGANGQEDDEQTPAQRADQDHRMRQVLGKLEVTSCGTIYSYSPIGTQSGFSSGLPVSGDHDPPHVMFRRVYEVQRDGWGREQVIGQAQRALDALTKRTLPAGFTERPETIDERRARLLDKGRGLTVREAAFRLNCSERELLRLRRDEGLSPEDGSELDAAPTRAETRDGRAARARELKQRNPRMSNRQIAAAIGVSHVSVAVYLSER